MTQRHLKISIDQARNFFLKKQLLNNTTLSKGKTGTMQIIEKLGYLQIDTINVVERSHHIVLYTRSHDYKKDYLHELQAKDKKIFEYWAHAASFIPMKDYRYYIRTIERKPKENSWLGKWIKKNRRLIEQVHKRIIKEGALTPGDFGDVAGRKRGTWWDWKPAKMALEVLFWQGVLMIKERRNFQRVYDLTERVLPKNLDTTKPSEDEEKKYFIKKALGAMGIATIKDINGYIGVPGKLNDRLEKMIKSGEIFEVEIDKIKKHYFMLSDDIEEFERHKNEIDSKVHMLSPFDNAIILRDRTKDIFDFKYSLECYVPKHKRKYGYFCLPILWQNQLVGRIDPKADRQNKILFVNNLHLENDIADIKLFIPALADTLNNFNRFNNCEKLRLDKKISSKIRTNISKYL